jgi:MFS family permease
MDEHLALNENRFTRFNTFSIVAVSILWMFEVAAVAPALGSISQAFPDASMFQIRMVMMAPFISIFVFSIISGGILAKRFDKKAILIVGIILYGVTGVLPAFVTDISIVLLLRVLTGVGAGLIVPHSNTIISQHFAGETRKRLLGANMAVANFGNVFINIIVSVLLVFGWQFTFYSFVLVFIILVLVVFGVPKSPPYRETVTNGTGSAKEKLPGIIYALAVLNAFSMGTFGSVPTNMSIYLTQRELVPVWAIGMIMSISAIAAIVSGILVPEFMKLLKRQIIAVSLLAAGVGFYLLYSSQNMVMLIAGLILCGVGSQGLIPPVIFEMTAQKTSAAQRDLAFGVINSSIYIGSFCGPFLQALITKVGRDDSIEFIFLGTGIIVIVAGVVGVIITIATRRRSGTGTGEEL